MLCLRHDSLKGAARDDSQASCAGPEQVAVLPSPLDMSHVPAYASDPTGGIDHKLAVKSLPVHLQDIRSAFDAGQLHLLDCRYGLHP